MNTVLDVKSVSKRFGHRWVLKNANARFPRGSITALLGPNGAGKSTLLKLCLGSLRPDPLAPQGRGRISVCGFAPSARQARERTGYVPDQPDVYGWMTPRELFAFVAPQYPSWDAALCTRACERLALPLDTAFRKLSKGEGVKAMLVTALAQRPELLLLDEPFGGLDPRAREELTSALLAEMRPENGAVVVATHELEIAARVADRAVMLDGGSVTREGNVAEILGGGEELDRVPARLRTLYDPTRLDAPTEVFS